MPAADRVCPSCALIGLYNQLLLRYNEMTKMHAAIPTPVVVMKSNNEPVVVMKSNNEPVVVMKSNNEPVVKSTEPVNIVATLPKTLQKKGLQLLSHLSKVEWNERGELIYEGVAIPGSNAVDLVHDLLRNRKTATDPLGWHQFAKQMRSVNIPMELVGNEARRKHMQKKPTPRKHIQKTPHPKYEFASQNLIFPDTIQGDTTCIQDAARTCSPVPPRSDPVPQRQAGSSFCRHTAECSDDSVSDIWGSSVLLHWTDLVELAPI